MMNDCYGCHKGYVIVLHTCGTTSSERFEQYQLQGGEDDDNLFSSTFEIFNKLPKIITKNIKLSILRITQNFFESSITNTN